LPAATKALRQQVKHELQRRCAQQLESGGQGTIGWTRTDRRLKKRQWGEKVINRAKGGLFVLLPEIMKEGGGIEKLDEIDYT